VAVKAETLQQVEQQPVSAVAVALHTLRRILLRQDQAAAVETV
jgi:hypothetical protein